MILFVLYALLIWFGTSKFRRRWPAFAILAAGVGLVLILHRVFLDLIVSPGPGMMPAWIYVAIWPYAGLILLVGLIFALSGPLPQREGCRRCGYDLTGLTHRRCPECGYVQPPRTELPGGAALSSSREPPRCAISNVVTNPAPIRPSDAAI